MAIDNRIGTKVIKSLQTDAATATRVDPYPYIGVVKNNLDPTRSGRLQVFVPELGGNPDDQTSWRTVSYASPYSGYTSTEQKATDRVNANNGFESVSHSYGFWAVPPDIGVEVIIIFIAGDPSRGYWIACVNPNLSHYMLPAMGGSNNIDTTLASEETKKSILETQAETGNVNVPVVEFNENLADNLTNPNFYNIPKPVHEVQYNVLKNQGLDRDNIRGTITSSSQRETPSHVFGISTPGRPTNDPADDPTFTAKLNSGTLTEEYYKVTSRKGGHSFVMDDGSVLGQDQLTRLRTAKGHQILLHDTESTIYIGHGTGNSWIEMSKDGDITVYAKNGFNVRSEGSINLHSDLDININANRNLNIRSGNEFQLNSVTAHMLSEQIRVSSFGNIEIKSKNYFKVESENVLSLLSDSNVAIGGMNILQNDGSTLTVNDVSPMPLNTFDDVVLNANANIWQTGTATVSSIVTMAPTHEPYNRSKAPTGDISYVASPTLARYKYTKDSTKEIAGVPVSVIAVDSDLTAQPYVNIILGKLTKMEFTAYLTQIGKSESNSTYAYVGDNGYLGKYQLGNQALISLGYLVDTATEVADLDVDTNWTSKRGAENKAVFLADANIQEYVAQEYTRFNYSAMVANGCLTADLTNDAIGGMLAVAHKLGATGAFRWRTQGAGELTGLWTTEYETGNRYYQQGRYAITVLAPRLALIIGG